MLLEPKFIYFDLDDTLLDHKSAEQAGLKDVHNHFDLFNGISSKELIDTYQKVNSTQWKLYSKNKVTRQELQRNRFEQTLDSLSLDSFRYEEVGTYYMKSYRNHWQWIRGAQKAFHKIREFYSVGVLTNGFSETQQKKFEQFDLYDKASHLVISEDVGVLKPHHKVFDHATELTGLQPADILYIGDSFNSDVIGGINYGWKVAWFTSNGDPEKHRKADFVFNDFERLIDLLKV
ncbi:MAG: HAD family hydrolase [Balneolaceae bacterium]|nr:HAD family hydrolase [Balneolaceae bacterium]